MVCLKCNKEFKSSQPKAKYCSRSCKKKALYYRQKEKVDTSNMFSIRWELLWRVRPDLRPLMLHIEDKVYDIKYEFQRS